MQGRLALIQVLDKLANTMLEEERLFLIDPFIRQDNAQTRVQISQLTQPLRQDVVVEVNLAEDAGVGLEVYTRSGSAVSPMASSSRVVTPRSKPITHTRPSRRVCTSIHSDSALTTLTPTPCSPPETL